MKSPASLWCIPCFLGLLLMLGAVGSVHRADAAGGLTATFIGIGADIVGQTDFSPDGQPDFQIHLDGLRSAPAQITVTNDNVGIWNTPFDGSHWIVGIANFNPSSADVYLARSLALASWFGVSAADLQAVFPNLGRFDQSSLGFLG